MKRIVALALAILAVLTVACGCVRKEADIKAVALIEYFDKVKDEEITDDDITYIGENEETRRYEYLVEHDDLKEKFFVAEIGNMYRIYDETGMFIYMYTVEETTK